MRFLKKPEQMFSISKLTEKLRRDKKLSLLTAVSVILTAVLIISGIPSGEKKETPSDKRTQQSYEKEMEERLAELISAIDGAGEAKVMVTLENGEESVYARNSDMQSEDGDVDRVQSGQEYVIIKSGNEEKGLELKTVYPEISGVAVVCHGAESALVRQRIITTVTAVLSVSSAKVSVVKMKTEGK